MKTFSRLFFLFLFILEASGPLRLHAGARTCDLTRQPLILIPGGAGTKSLAEDSDGLAHLYQWLQGDGYEEGCNLFFAGQVSALDTRQENRLLLSRLIASYAAQVKILNPQWNGRFDIIGHSFGGLIARFYLESAVYQQDQAQGIFIDNLFTLGTPHGGARVPDELYPATLIIAGEPLFAPGDVLEFLSVAQLQSDVMDFYNRNHRQPQGTTYHLIAGDFLQQEDVPLAVRLLYGAYESAPGDIAVSLRSAGRLADEDLTGRYPRVCLNVTADMHGYSTEFGLGDLQSYVRPSTTYTNFIREQIGSRAEGCQSDIVEHEFKLFMPIALQDAR